jgi:HK97 family phage portal protein
MEILTTERKFETRGANPLQPWGSTAPPPPGQGYGTAAAGVVISEHTALQLAAVYGSVSIICDSLATLPIRQYRATGPDTAVQIDPSPVIAQPWPEITQRDYITQGTASMLLRGNLFGNITGRDEPYLLPSQVQLVHPDHAKRRRLPNGTIETRYWNQVVSPDNVTMAMALSVPESIVGLNPIEYMRNVLGVARAQDLYGGAFFSNSARPDGVITLEGDYDPDEAVAVKNSWLEAHQGINASHLPAVLTGGATFKPITVNASDAQFLEQMQLSASTISGMLYRVPPHMIGMVTKDTSWGAGIEQQELGYVRNTLLNWLGRWEDLMTSWLPSKQFVMFDLSQRLRGDTLQRWAAYQIARVIGAMSNSEVREAEGLPPVTDPDANDGTWDAFNAPLNSAPMPAAVAQGGDKAN